MNRMFTEEVEHGVACAECQKAHWKTFECWGTRRSGYEEVAPPLSLLIEIKLPRIHICCGKGWIYTACEVLVELVFTSSG